MTSKKPYNVLILCGFPGTGKSSIAEAYRARFPARVRVIDARKTAKQAYSLIIKTPESSFSHSESYKKAFEDSDGEKITFGQLLDDFYVSTRFCSPTWSIWAASVKADIDELNKNATEKLTFVIDDVISFDECQYLLAEAELGVVIKVQGFPGAYNRPQPERASHHYIEDICERVTTKLNSSKKKNESFDQRMFRLAEQLEKIEKSLSEKSNK